MKYHILASEVSDGRTGVMAETLNVWLFHWKLGESCLDRMTKRILSPSVQTRYKALGVRMVRKGPTKRCEVERLPLSLWGENF